MKKTVGVILIVGLIIAFPVFAQDVPKVKEKVTITLWHGLTAADGQYMEKLMQQYCTEKNPNIKLEASAIAWSDLYTKLKTAFLSKSLPTMVIIHAQTVPIYAGNAVKPIDDLIPSLKLQGRILDSFYQITKWEGKTYYIPLTLVTSYTYFWKKDLQNLGFDSAKPPATLDQIKAFGKKATRTVGGKNVVGVQIDWSYGDLWHDLMYSYGGKLLSDDGKKAMFNSPEGLKALKVLLDWWYDSKISLREDVGSFDDQVKRFVNHEAASFLTYTSMVGHIDSIGRENMAYQHTPSAEGGKPYATAYYHGVCLPRTGTKVQDQAAMEIVNWMLDPRINADFSAGSGQLPGVKAAYETELWKKDGWWLNNDTLSIITPLPYISHKHRDRIQEVLDQWFNKVRDKQITPEEGLAGAEKDVNLILTSM